MKKENVVQVVNNNEYGMRVARGSTSIEFSQDFVQHICAEMINLGTQFVCETGKVTVEFFHEQSNRYRDQLDAYINKQKIDADIRKLILIQLKDAIDKYMDLIRQVNNLEDKKSLQYGIDVLVDVYKSTLQNDSENKLPEMPKSDILEKIKGLVSRNKS